MTKQDYEDNKAKIIAEFGTPEWDNFEPMNESATRLSKLKTEYRLYCRSEKRLQDKANGEKQQQTLNELGQEIKENKKYKRFGIGSIEVNDKDLLPFSEKEQDVIRNHFDNWNLNHQELGIKSNVSRQFVTALLHTPAYLFLEQKIFDKLMPSEVKIALLQATRAGDSKIVQRLAEHYKILNPEKVEIDLNKPIDDPKALAMLREIGDRLVNEDK
jgi:hypothetical protein